MYYEFAKLLAEIAYYALVPPLALVGGGIALWRNMVANRNLRQERFKVGADYKVTRGVALEGLQEQPFL